MELDKTIKERKSVRDYTSKTPDWRKIIECIDSMRLAPMAGNIFSLKFILVSDSQKIQKLAEASQQDFVAQSQYVVVVCTDKKMILNEYGKVAEKEWLNTKTIRPNVDLDYFVIMPDHMHGIVVINERQQYRINSDCRDTELRVPTIEQFGNPVPGSLPTIIRSYKATVTKQINELRNTPGLKFWQRNYYEHIIRNEKELYRIRKYIEQNPLKWELEKGFPENLDI